MEQSYRDHDEQLLHAFDNPPVLNVMLIGKKQDFGRDGEIYQRLGLGEIYLKKWVEACPSFSTIVLE